MSIAIGSKVKTKEDTYPSALAGKTGTVISLSEDAEWDWDVQLDFDPNSGPYGFYTAELETTK